VGRPVTYTTDPGRHVLAMSLSAHALSLRAREVADVIDRAHMSGLAIPAAVAPAVEVLASLAVCWDANSRGLPAPQAAKAALGLDTPGEVT